MNTLPYPSQALASQGRYGDSTLVHMTPQEVSGLQALARSHGTSLTVNPQTGLPEAFNLKGLLPTLIGAGLTIGSGGALSPLMAGMMTGAGYGLATGDVQQGLMAGLGAYGGAGLGAGLGAAGAAAPGAAVPGIAGGGGAAELASVGQTGFGMTGPMTPTIGQNFAQAGQGVSALGTEPGRAAFMKDVGGLSGLAKYGGTAAAPMLFGGEQEGGDLKRHEHYLRPYDLDITNVSGTYDPLESSREREQLRYNFRARDPIRVAQGGAIRYQEGGEVTPAEADVYRNIANVQQMAEMGQMPMGNMMARPQFTSYTDYNPATMKPFEAPPMMGSDVGGSFRSQQYDVPRFKPEDSVSFREIQEKNNPFGSSDSEIIGYTEGNRPIYRNPLPSGTIIPGDPVFSGGGPVRYQEGGLAAMMRPEEAMTPPMDGRFLRGNGDGMSDEIPASIEGEQDALLSDGEFVIPADVVSHIGNGSSEAGAKILYQMMDRVRKARTGKEEQAEEIDVEEFLPV
jgi:hypothetical protein